MSLNADYFDGIFEQDDDPWHLASSAHEAAKFDRTIAALQDRRYRKALEIGCAHGVLTKRLSVLCDALLAVDISATALDKARARLADLPGITLQQMAFPRETPDSTGFDLVMLSEVAYYWDAADLRAAAHWLAEAVAPGGRIILVHWLGETDYPQTGDGAVGAIWTGLAAEFIVETAERLPDYRLDVWTRR